MPPAPVRAKHASTISCRNAAARSRCWPPSVKPAGPHNLRPIRAFTPVYCSWMEVAVIGAGPAGLAAALRAAELGAQTTLVTRDALGGMAATDGPVPVRVLAHAARLLREARQLEEYGIAVGLAELHFSRIL